MKKRRPLQRRKVLPSPPKKQEVKLPDGDGLFLEDDTIQLLLPIAESPGICKGDWIK